MGKFEKVLYRVLSGEFDANVEFEDLVWLLRKLNFDLRISGSHHVFRHGNLNRIVNIQPRKDGKRKIIKWGKRAKPC